MKIKKFQLLALVVAMVTLFGAGAARAQSIYEPYSFTTLAGLALNPGTNDDTGGAARFDQPWGVAVDGAGNVFVADTLNQTIRKIAPGGVVTTLAGVAGSNGFNDGDDGVALFNRPTGVAVNRAGTVVYVADRNNHVIRQISGGVVTTLAGTGGVSGSADGTGDAARFNFPVGVAADNSGNVYVTDTLNQTIRMIAPGGVVTTLAGSPGLSGSIDGTNSPDARFNSPTGIAVDGNGNLYVADAGNYTIRKIQSSGGVGTLAGLAGNSGFTDGSAGTARFSGLSIGSPFGGPYGVGVDSYGNVYVSDQGNHVIRKITPDGGVTTVAGLALTSGGTDGAGSDARFNFPAGVAVDAAGTLFVADTANHTIRLGVAVQPIAPPVITREPQSQTAAAGSRVIFSAAATGTPPLSYQWLLNGKTISGATNTSYTIASASPADVGSYVFVVANAYGSATSVTAPFLLIGTEGTLVCQDGSPITGCTVEVDFWAGGSLAVSSTATTDSTGHFALNVDCGAFAGVQTGREFIISASCCPNQTWTFPQQCCCGDLGTLVCNTCGAAVTCNPGRVIWVDAFNGIDGGDLSGANQQLELPVFTPTAGGVDVALNPLTGKIYWGDNSTTPGKVMEADEDGANSRVVTTTVPGEHVHHIAVDSSATRVYWDDFNLGTIHRADIIPNSVSTPVSIPCMATDLRGIALDVRSSSQNLYYYDGVYIYRADLDGANATQLPNPIGDGMPGEFALDTCNDRIYVISETDPHPGVPVPYIRYANLSDGSGLVTILSGETVVGDLGYALALDLHNRTMYWTSQNNAAQGQIKNANMDTGGGVTVLPAGPTGGSEYRGITLCLPDYSCTSGSTNFANKDFQNNTGQAADGVDWLIQGTYSSVVDLYNGPYPNQPNSTFSSFTIVPSGANTLLRWSGAASIPNGGFAHVGFGVVGTPLITLGVSWTVNGANAGCIHQVSVGEGFSHDFGQVSFRNTALACESPVLYVGNIRLEWFVTNVPLADLNGYAVRFPIRTDDVTSPPVALSPGVAAPLTIPPPPVGAHFAMIRYAVSASPTLAGPGNTIDYQEVALSSGANPNCVQMTGASNKMVACGSSWVFDAPTNIIATCCTNFRVNFSAVTNGICPLTITGTWLVSDTCGNQAACSQTVTVVSTNPPVLGCSDDKTVPCAADWAFDPPAALDACGGTNVTITILNTLTNGNGCSKVITRTWLATDCSGNTATCSQTVTLTDATPPVITQPPLSQTLAVGGTASFSVTATGTPPLTYSWYFNGVPTTASVSNVLSISPAQIANAGNYWVVIQNAGGAVTSQVANLNVLPPSPPSGLSLTITNDQGRLFVDVWDDGSSGLPWQLQSTTNLLNADWVTETNGAGNGQFAAMMVSKATFFRAGRLQPPGASTRLQALYGGLPAAQFNTGLLLAPPGAMPASILNSAGTPLDIDAAIPPDLMLSSSDFLHAYNTLRFDSVRGVPTLPDLKEVKVSINPAAPPIRLEQNLAFQHIYAVALTIVPYNTLATNAFADGRLNLVDSNNLPIDLSNTNRQTNTTAVFVAEGANSGSYVETNLFAGAGLFRTALQNGTEPLKFMLPKEFLVAPGIVDSLQIRFPGVPLVVTNGGTFLADQGFLDIAPDQLFSRDFSSVSTDTNGNAEIPFVVRASIGGNIYDAVGRFTLHRIPAAAAPQCSSIPQYFYPLLRPYWWPNSSWATKPSDPQAFFTGARPGWWPLSWPCVYDNYVYKFVYHFLHIPPITYSYEPFGILTIQHDVRVWGPYWNSATGVANSGPQSANNSADGYNLRFYPATYRANAPDRCQAMNLVLVVDGIDTRDGGVARTEEDMWNDFWPEGQKLLDKGYDLLVLNYVNGDDYIQRNAYALLTVLQDYVPGYMAPGHENDRVAIVAASMGTQVTRYALLAAEQKLKVDHHTGLAVYLDGPFLGANIPWASQGLLQFLANNTVFPPADCVDAQDALNNVLLSPAAKQLLRAGINYAPDQAYNDYYTEMRTGFDPGLPQQVRNVAVSCGSGSGVSQEGTRGTFPGIDLASLGTGQQNQQQQVSGFGTWAEFNVTADSEGPTQPGPQQQVLSTFVEAGPILFNQYVEWFGYESDSATWDIQAGARPSDLSPGGFTTLSKSIVDEYNAAATHLGGMTGYGQSTFIPVFSALYVRGAESGVEQIKATQDRAGTSGGGYGTTSLIGWQTPLYRTHADFWYGPENNSSNKIDSATMAKSPFDAIWYQATNNMDHVFKHPNSYFPPGYEAFLINELDQFTAHEPVTTESALVTAPKMPLHEEYLAGDLAAGYGADLLLTINTMTRSNMVQAFFPSSTSPTWIKLTDTSSSPGMIGGWPINKGDKFYLARLIAGGPKLLVSFSAATPARAMVQRMTGPDAYGQYQWQALWDNTVDGRPSGLIGPFKIHTTDLIAIGDTDGSGFDKLLIGAPYVCADGAEKTVPGTSALSKVSLLTFNGTGWTETWNNYDPQAYQGTTIDLIGKYGIRFGDRLMFGRLPTPNDPAGTTNSLFMVNLFRGVFGGPAMVQNLVPGFANLNWNQLWSDGGATSLQPCQSFACSGNIGCWTLGNPRDSFYFADLEGDGLDKLICANTNHWEEYSYDGSNPSWCSNPGSGGDIVTGDFGYIGQYGMGLGDRFIFGHFDPSFAGELMLCLNPLPQAPSGARKPAILQQFTAGGWVQRWPAPPSIFNPPGDPRSLGNWYLYQDLP